jgi:hypothetical protein
MSLTSATWVFVARSALTVASFAPSGNRSHPGSHPDPPNDQHLADAPLSTAADRPSQRCDAGPHPRVQRSPREARAHPTTTIFRSTVEIPSSWTMMYLKAKRNVGDLFEEPANARLATPSLTGERRFTAPRWNKPSSTSAQRKALATRLGPFSSTTDSARPHELSLPP